jgi:hypothetical protein
MKNLYQLATMAGQQIKALDYEDFFHDDVMKCKQPGDVVNLWLDFLIENRDEPGFILRVNNAGTLPALLSWCESARELLSLGA